MSNQETVIYQLLKVYDKPEFKELYKELKSDEMACDTCFAASQNYFVLVKYQFIQEISETSNINTSIFREELGVFGTCIDFTYDLQGNENILADITYPLEYVENIPVCNYYTVFWCNPGVWKKTPPVVIIDINDQQYRLKGHILKMNFINAEKIMYRIKLTNCNCFLDKVLEAENYSAKLTIIPGKNIDNFGTLRSNNTYADKFTI